MTHVFGFELGMVRVDSGKLMCRSRGTWGFGVHAPHGLIYSLDL